MPTVRIGLGGRGSGETCVAAAAVTAAAWLERVLGTVLRRRLLREARVGRICPPRVFSQVLGRIGALSCDPQPQPCPAWERLWRCPSGDGNGAERARPAHWLAGAAWPVAQRPRRCRDGGKPVQETDFPDYRENDYGKVPRMTDAAYRAALTSWQVPAIQRHCGDLTGKVFLDIGAGDIVLGEKLDELGVPRKFYVQDLSRPSLLAGLQRLQATGIDTRMFRTLVSDSFDFAQIEDEEVDFAFSNSLFSHLSINSIVLCLRNLHPKLKMGASYFSSMIVLPDDTERLVYDWSHLDRPMTQVVSSSVRDPFHYTPNTICNLQHLRTGFTVRHIHDYGHPFQKLVEFQRC